MSKLREYLDIFATAVSLGAITFMAWVFYNEGFRGHGVYYYEPNRYIAIGELIATILGFVSVLFLYIKRPVEKP